MSQQQGIMTAEPKGMQVVAQKPERTSETATLTQLPEAGTGCSSELEELWQECHLSLQEKDDRLARYFNNPDHPRRKRTTLSHQRTM